MDLYSPQDRILLKNCIIVKIKQLNLEMLHSNKDFSTIKNEIDYYTNLKKLLETGNTENLIAILNNSIVSSDYVNFNKYILSTPSKDIAEKYVELTKSIMMENGVYSEENFERLKQAFYNGNENLMQTDKTKNLDELEEEHAPETSQYLTESVQQILDQLANLFKQHNAKTMSASQFQDFSSQLKMLTKTLGIYKLQQSFDELGQTVTDMQVFYEKSEENKPIYTIDLTLLDANSQQAHRVLTERATASGYISTYFQNLCYTYLEANKYAMLSENLLDTNIITNKMITFSECHKKLKEMAKYKLNILSNNTIGVSTVAADEPTKELEIE